MDLEVGVLSVVLLVVLLPIVLDGDPMVEVVDAVVPSDFGRKR